MNGQDPLPQHEPLSTTHRKREAEDWALVLVAEGFEPRVVRSESGWQVEVPQDARPWRLFGTGIYSTRADFFVPQYMETTFPSEKAENQRRPEFSQNACLITGTIKFFGLN